MLEAINEAVSFIRNRIAIQPDIAIILGTGLGNRLADLVEDAQIIPYGIIPHFPRTTVESHKGQLVAGKLSGRAVIILRGRWHYYEGYSMHQIALPVRVLKGLGIRYLLISNAAGCLNEKWSKGELMLLTDHLALQPDNPLRGLHYKQFGERFVDMSKPYDNRLMSTLRKIAQKHNIVLREGVYAAVQGPSLETRAEYRFLRIIGADAVGMSTVPEVLTAVQCGIKCCAVSVLTNEGKPDKLRQVSLQEIIQTAQSAEENLAVLFTGLIERLTN
ncbi:MAG: purine-nucleoside phosphorylase [Cyclobacteriaceae bacterium]|nr:purine-nucleoside phosphorylase [Cyclobacteriaceae bacterium]MDW8330723.1 purine-nucleoside phosphorylase [Cyclobacteriaceae bacterium]